MIPWPFVLEDGAEGSVNISMVSKQNMMLIHHMSHKEDKRMRVSILQGEVEKVGI